MNADFQKGENMEMSLGLYALFAALPLISAGVLLVGFRLPAKVAMPIVYIITTLVAFYVWEVSFTRIEFQ